MDIIELAIEFALLIIIFSLVERFFRSDHSPSWFKRLDAKTDVGYFFVNSIFTPVMEAISIFGVVAAISILSGASLVELREIVNQLSAGEVSNLTNETSQNWIASQPLWLQILLGITIADFVYYWMHRLFHKRPFWRLHAIHHSPPILDWLSAMRSHPIEDAITATLQVMPLLFLGFSSESFVIVTPIIAVWSVFTHANVSWDFGIFKYVIISPRFHRWHHTSEKEGLDKNFAGIFPIFDLIFGTWYMPNRIPTKFGAGKTRVPAGLFRQLIFPFKSAPKDAKLAKDIGIMENKKKDQ